MAQYAAQPAADAERPDTPDLAALARYWIDELDTAERDPERQKWLERCKQIIKNYREDRGSSRANRKQKRFALFWSSVQTIAPALYSRTPTAVVTRRFRDGDPVGRLASEILERGLNFAIDACDFSGTMLGCRDEYLLLARGQAWVRYVPTLRTETGAAEATEVADSPEPYEVVDWEQVLPDRLHYEDFLHNPARSWGEVRWGARRAFMTRKELTDRFPECGAHVPLDYAPNGREDAPDDQKKAVVHEIWDRVTKQAIWVAKGYPNRVLDVRPDPLKLEEFFPFPRPLFGTLGPDSLVPTPDYIYWQDQSEEVDNLTTRIDKLIDALRARGFYSSSNGTDLNQLLKSDDNTLIPVEGQAVLGDQGGLKGIIDWFPVEQVATVLKACFDARRQLVEDIYQVTGISDIQRGASDPDETAAAQKIKASFGSLRVRDRQKEIGRFARDLLRIMGEIIASRFDPKTLSAMTGVQLLTAAEKTQAQQAMAAYQAVAQQAQAAGQPPPPPPVPPQVVQQLNQPTWDDVMGVLRSPVLRAFRIDIETDSTIEPNDQDEKQRRVEFVEAVGQYLANSLPVVQANPAILPVITQGLLFLVRGFRVGREMEDVVERAMEQLQQGAQGPQQPQQPPPDPADQAKAQAAVMQAQAAQGRVQVEAQRVASDHQLGLAQVQAENNRTAATTAQAMHEAVLKASERRLVHEINDQTPPTVTQQ